MGYLGRLSRSAELTQGMAERLGVDVPASLDRTPEISATQFRSAVLRCLTCKEQDACAHLQSSTASLEAAPSYCQNRWK